MSEPKLTSLNYTQGFLMDNELMAGVTQAPESPQSFAAFVLNHRTGEYLGYRAYSNLEEALASLNSIPREWAFERSKNCGGCGEGQSCTLGECGKGSCHLTE